MKVTVSEDLFDPVFLQANSLGVAALFNYGLDRHIVIPRFNVDTSGIFLAWVESRPTYEREAVKLVVDLGIEAEARGASDNEIRVEAHRVTSDWSARPPRLALSDALKVLGLPLSIVVEDAENDGAFLRAVVTGPEREEFHTALDKGWIELRHGGGNTSIRRFVGLIARTNGARLRSWIIVDGDALAPGRPSAETKRISRLCARNQIPVHALERRAMENYI